MACHVREYLLSISPYILGTGFFFLIYTRVHILHKGRRSFSSIGWTSFHADPFDVNYMWQQRRSTYCQRSPLGCITPQMHFIV